MAPAVNKTMWEQLQAEVSRLRSQVEALTCTPLLWRKDVAQKLGVTERTVSRRMKRRDFPKPIYDAGRPKWTPAQFTGQASPG